MKLYAYIVRYDSGFAPNPFYNICTLATCKPQIRCHAQIGDWVIGWGSKEVDQEQKLVYAMRVSEYMTYNEYFLDPRFQGKRPILNGSKKQARGDNIYRCVDGKWEQMNSYHSNEDGTPKIEHVEKDTSADRVLISDYYVYFGGGGWLKHDDMPFHRGRSHKIYKMEDLDEKRKIERFLDWFEELDERGYVNPPHDW